MIFNLLIFSYNFNIWLTSMTIPQNPDLTQFQAKDMNQRIGALYFLFNFSKPDYCNVFESTIN